MRTCQRLRLHYVALLLVLPALSAVLLLLPSPRKGARSQVIRVGYCPNLTHMQALVGLRAGTFARHLGPAVIIEPHPFTTGTAEVQAMLAGKIDLGYLDPSPAVSGHVRSRGGALRVVAGAAQGGPLLVARKGIAVTRVEDLQGRRVAVPELGSTEDVLLRRLLHGDGVGRVRVVGMGNVDTLDAFRHGEVEAACVPEPWATRLLQEAGARIVAEERRLWQGGEGSSACVVVSTGFLRRQPELVRRWLAAHAELTDRLNRRLPTDAIIANAQIGRITGQPLPGRVLFPALERVRFTTDPLPRTLAGLGQAAWELGYLQSKPDLSGLVAAVPEVHQPAAP